MGLGSSSGAPMRNECALMSVSDGTSSWQLRRYGCAFGAYSLSDRTDTVTASSRR